MSIEIKGKLSSTGDGGIKTIFAAVTLTYCFVYIFKLFAYFVGYCNKITISLTNDILLFNEELKMMGVKVKKSKSKIPLSNIIKYGEGDDGDENLLILGVSFLFYFSLFGMISVFMGLFGNESGFLIKGIILIFIGFIIDILIFVLFKFLQKKSGKVIYIHLTNGKLYKIRNSSNSINLLLEKNNN
jgi:hypothetical protein